MKLKSLMAPVESLFSKNTPDYCELVVTEKCFFKCKMCEMWKRKHEEQPSLKEWKKFVKSFRNTIRLPYRISIVGGETLTYPHIYELIEFCSSLGFNVTITTNGFLINKSVAKKLFDSGLKEIVISLDSFDEKIHNEIRGVKNSYKKVMKAIDMLSEYDISINLLSVIMSLNQNSLIPLVEWANKNDKVNSINFNALTEPLATNVGDNWHNDSQYSYLWPEDSKIIDELIDMEKKGYKIGNPISQLITFKNYYMHPEKFVKNGSCHMGSSVSVNSEGHVFMCHYMGSIGNIKEHDFRNMWRSKNSKGIRKDILECEKNCKMLINCNFEE